MKNLTKVIALTVGLLTSSAYADSNTKGMYFGIGAVQSSSTSKGTFTEVSGTVTSYTAKYKKTNYKALIGKRLNDNISVELQYVDFAKDDLTDDLAAKGIATESISMTGESIGVVGLYHFNPQADYSPFVKLGMHSWDFEFKTSVGESTKGDGTDVLYGVGLDGKINDSMRYRLEFERMDLNGSDMDNIGVGLLVSF
ncbi:hypothetical protein MNB_SUP05-SYMBIONT-5-1429 [hydrothermal vent metagenome]|uniref:Outer membrane protein beta-barrel domain-containing protein n=1 Tax=hydrothermal vent metagenome TaxID=652676 RepID=A0A1W1E5D6_9ZZZZ